MPAVNYIFFSTGIEGFQNLQGLPGRQAFSLSACPDSSGRRHRKRMRRKPAAQRQQGEIAVQ